MKSKIILRLFALTAIALIAPVISPAKADPTAGQPSQIESLKKTYPLTTCVVSGDALNSPDMGGKPVDYLYTQKNADGTETQRLIRFCCKDCLKTFKKDPEKYLKQIDAAEAKTAPAPATK